MPHMTRMPDDGDPCKGIARMMSCRRHGGITFADARWKDLAVQLMFQRDVTAEYDRLTSLAMGTVISFEGKATTTRTGRRAILVDAYSVLIFCRRSLPDKRKISSDENRYLEQATRLVMDQNTYAFAVAIADMTMAMRTGLAKEGFREFNTGVLQRQFEGGLARPFMSTCRSNGKVYSLSLTSELKLKRLIVAGCERVCEITQSFRNEGMDALHSPEFTLLEAYAVGTSCATMCQLLEMIVHDATRRFFERFEPSGIQENLARVWSGPFVNVPFSEAYERFVDPKGFDDGALDRLVCMRPDMFTKDMPRFTWVMKVIERLMIPHMTNPMFITWLPSELSPLVKSVNGQEHLTFRSFFVAGNMFIADIYEDENDPDIVRAALEEQARMSGRPVNEDFLKILEFGIPPTAGIGMGLNRLFMALAPFAGLPQHIKETTLFPL